MKPTSGIVPLKRPEPRLLEALCAQALEREIVKR
jgi:hypothetical protein